MIRRIEEGKLIKEGKNLVEVMNDIEQGMKIIRKNLNINTDENYVKFILNNAVEYINDAVEAVLGK